MSLWPAAETPADALIQLPVAVAFISLSLLHPMPADPAADAIDARQKPALPYNGGRMLRIRDSVPQN